MRKVGSGFRRSREGYVINKANRLWGFRVGVGHVLGSHFRAFIIDST